MLGGCGGRCLGHCCCCKRLNRKEGSVCWFRFLEIAKSSRVRRLSLRKKKMQWSGRIISYQRRYVHAHYCMAARYFLTGYLVTTWTTSYRILYQLPCLVIDLSSISEADTVSISLDSSNIRVSLRVRDILTQFLILLRHLSPLQSSSHGLFLL